jgi:hypothetical protein
MDNAFFEQMPYEHTWRAASTDLISAAEENGQREPARLP